MPRSREPGSESLHTARAAVALAALLVLFVLPTPRERAAACDFPVESAARDGISVEVSCADEPRPDAPLRGPARLLFGQRLPLNLASAQSLEVLPAIGPSRAAAIVAARARAPFRRLDDLLRVPGIGPRTLQGLAGWAEVESLPLSTD